MDMVQMFARLMDNPYGQLTRKERLRTRLVFFNNFKFSLNDMAKSTQCEDRMNRPLGSAQSDYKIL